MTGQLAQEVEDESAGKRLKIIFLLDEQNSTPSNTTVVKLSAMFPEILKK